MTFASLIFVGILFVSVFALNENVALIFNELLLASVLIIITPSAVLDYLNQRWINSIEDQMPVLVRGLAESQEIGMSIEDAFANVVNNKLIHGPLEDEVKKINIQLSWGMSFEDALQQFRERVKSPVVNRFCTLVLEANRSGGLIKKVFISTSGFMQEIREMDKETSSQMRPYIIVVYAAFLVFIFISIVLVNSFFIPLQGIQQIASTSTMPSVAAYKDFFYRTEIIMGLMGGLMAGKVSELRVMGGLKHSIIQIMIGYVIFLVTIPPNWVI